MVRGGGRSEGRGILDYFEDLEDLQIERCKRHWRMAMFETNPIDLKDLLDDVEEGKIQLPDFQRGWVWDDERIKSLLVSISRQFPVGAIMTLSADGDVQFQKRPIEGVTLTENERHERYLLDGQQRLTSLYQALRYDGPVDTRDARGRRFKRWYYVDMQKSLDRFADPEDVFISVPEDRVERTNFGRTEVLNLSTQDREFQNHMMPTERLMDATSWGFEYAQYWNQQDNPHPCGNAFQFFMEFQKGVLENFTHYKLPVINLDKDTSKEGVCTVFEKVNTGGVVLTVFELLTASLAADGFSLRDDWQERRDRLHSQYGVLRGVDSSNFLQAVALMSTQERRRQTPAGQSLPGIGCRRADILNLTLDEYLKWADKVEAGFEAAAKFLHSQFVFSQNNIPYNTQLVPLAALYAELGQQLESANAKARLERWYWSGVFGEAYGSAVETQYARDLEQVADYIRNGAEPTLIREANFAPTRLIGLKTRQSAAYKGLYALQMKSGAADWRTSLSLTLADWHNENIDIHHIFPRRWCERDSNPKVPQRLFNSIVNKTPIDAKTNRIIGGNAPSRYLPRLRQSNSDLSRVLETHWLNSELLEADKFAECFVQRGEAMLDLIGKAMGKQITGGQESFWAALAAAGFTKPPEITAPSEVEFDTDDMADEIEFDELGEAAYPEEQLAADD